MVYLAGGTTAWNSRDSFKKRRLLSKAIKGSEQSDLSSFVYFYNKNT